MDATPLTMLEVQQKFAEELNEVLRSVTNSYQIPIARNATPDKKLTIFIVMPDEYSKNRSKAKKSKRLSSTCTKISFSPHISMEIEEIIKCDGLYDLCLIFEFLKAEVVAPATSRITFWARGLYKSIDKWIETYGVNLKVLPFEVFFDENDKVQISGFPKFENLRFIETAAPTKLLSPYDVVQKHYEILKDLQQFLNSQNSQNSQ